MRKITAILAGLGFVFLAGPALAQPAPSWQPPPNNGPGMMMGSRPGPMMPEGQWQHPPHGYDNHYRRPYGGYGPPPGGWMRGDRFFGHPQMIIHNYGYYNLAPPPPGYCWTQYGNQFLMISIANGLIASIMMMPMH